MFRQPVARLRSYIGPAQRKLFLLVFLWTCFCLLLFRTSLFPAGQTSADAQHHRRNHQLDARSAGAALPAPPSSPSEAPATSQSLSNLKYQHKPTTSSLTTGHQSDRPAEPPQCSYDYPNLLDLQFNNIHWQRAKIAAPSLETLPAALANLSQPPATYYLYNAYYDDRWRGGVPSVRVLAMIDRVAPPPTDCLLWSSKLSAGGAPTTGSTTTAQAHKHEKPRPLVSRAQFVYAWYPKWGNYKDGLLQPWIVTCPIPREHVGLVPDSVSLVRVPELADAADDDEGDSDDAPADVDASINSIDGSSATRRAAKREAADGSQQQQGNSIAMPPSFSSSSPTIVIDSSEQQPPPVKLNSAGQIRHSVTTSASRGGSSNSRAPRPKLNCKSVGQITNNLPVFNHRPATKQKFAVCVKGLDFPHDDVSVRLVEWIEMLNLLGAGKIFLYELDVHENISKVLNYYQRRGLVELSPLTLPGDQPNLPEYQHLYLKNRLTSKRQNELIPYNDCLYRNLYSYQYLALLDIDEVIMPLEQQRNWFDLMEKVEQLSLAEQNYSRASYNVRNVYFFDDLSGPLGTTSSSSASASSASSSTRDEPDQQVAASSAEPADDNNNNSEEEEAASAGPSQHAQSLERGIPHYLHMMSHVYRSKNYTEPGQYVKCFHNTERVVSLHNHFPMNCFGQCTTYSIPVSLAHLQHYRKDCVGPLRQSCKSDFRVFTTRDTTIWKYKQRMIRRTTRVLSQLGLLRSAGAAANS